MNLPDTLIVNLEDRDLARFRGRYIVCGSGCWEWIRSFVWDGYGIFAVKGTNVRAHRLSFYLAKGFLPKVTDHLCRNRRCVNPDHLESVDDFINSARGASPAAHNLKKTHCIRGHEFNEENTIWRMSRTHRRKVRECATCTYVRDQRRRKTCD